MVLIKKVYIEPDDINGYTFDPIYFDSGINFILGERSDIDVDNPERNKMNGVGKSILVEIVDYCFMKDLSKSRLRFIPTHILQDTVQFCLDLEVIVDDVAQHITIKRSRLRKGADVQIIHDDNVIDFEKLEDAKDYLERYIVTQRDSDSPSLRQMLSILLRGEKTLYGDIFYTDANSKRFTFSDLLRPHLYLFNFKLDNIENIKSTLQRKKDATNVLSAVKAEFKAMNISADEVKAHIADVEDKLEKLNLALEGLAPAEVSIQKKQELKENLLLLDKLTSTRVSKEYMLRKIQSLPKTKAVDTEKLGNVYNAYKNGLGDLVVRNFDSVLAFRKEIDEFQADLVIEKQKELREEIRSISERIAIVDSEVSKFYKENIAKKKIDDLAEVAVSQREKDKELTSLKYKYDLYEDASQTKRALDRQLTSYYDTLNDQIIALNNVLQSFNEDLINMHAAITGNKRSQFDLKVHTKAQEYLQANYRINLDGSMGIDRIKTFIYDTLLMTNKYTSKKHPGFLVHDNIFAGTGRDDMVKGLNYVSSLALRNTNFQYIVTMNEDEYESYSEEFEFDIEKCVKKTLTRHEPLFGQAYDEKRDQS